MSQDTAAMDAIVDESVQENGKRKRQMSEKQLSALAEGRKKRWLNKQRELKEEGKESSEEEESTEQSSSGEESKTESDSDSVPSISTADESCE